LDLPFVTVVTGVEFSKDFKQAKITRQVEGGTEILELKLPLLLTCQKGLNEPRLPSLKGIMAAKKKEILTLSCADLGMEEGFFSMDDNRIVEANLSLPLERKKGIILKGSEEEISSDLVRLLREEEKII